MKRHRKRRGLRASINKNTVNNPAGSKYMKGGNYPKYFHGGEHTEPWEKKQHSTQKDRPTDYSKTPINSGTVIPDWAKAQPDFAADEAELDQAALEEESQALWDFGNEVEKDLGSGRLAIQDVMNQSITENEEDFDFQEWSPTEIYQPQDNQLFNPYGGVDVMSAANIFGQNLGKSKEDRNTLSMVGSGLKVVTGIGRAVASGAGFQKRNQFVVDEMNKKRREGLLSSSLEVAAEGGSITNPMEMGIDKGEENEEYMSALLTGDYSTGTQEGPANIEVERGEYIKSTDGNVTKVLGNSHAEGGEAMNVPQGSEIISNKLKLTPEQVKTLNDEYGVKTNTKDTYASAMDKFYKVIGLQDIIDEEEEVISTIEKQQEKSREEGADESTFNINLEFLSGKVNELNERKTPLQQQAASFFDEVFKLQESTKPAEAEQTEFKFGGTVYTQEDIKKIAKANNLDPKRGLEIIKKFSEGGKAEVKDPTEKERAKFKAWVAHLRKQGFEGKVNEDAEDLGAEAGKIQAWMVKNHPESVVRYFKDNPITSKGIKMLQGSEQGKELFKSLGIDGTKGPGQYSAEERIQIQNEARKAGLVSRDFLLNQFEDNLWSFRSPGVTPINKVETQAAPAKELERREVQFDLSRPLSPVAPLTSEVDNGLDIQGDLDRLQAQGPGEIIEGWTPAEDDPSFEGSNVFILPDQSPLPPTGMQPHLKARRRYGRVDANLMTPDAQLAELKRNVAAARKTIANLPSGQREAAEVQLTANEEAAAQKILSGVEAYNQGAKSKADIFNTRQGDREEEAQWMDLLNYEQRSLTALGNTEDDFRRYFNEGTSRNVQNFNTIESLNLMNQMNENFNITGSGVEFTGTPGIQEQWENNIHYAQAMPKSTETTKSKKKKRGRTT